MQAQNIGTVAGGGHPGSLATAYAASGASSVAVDASGNLYVAVTGANQVWVVSSSGAVAEVIGDGPAGSTVVSKVAVLQPVYSGAYRGDGGPATLATLNSPSGVALDSKGNLYIADTGNNVIRKVDASTGIITTLAGTGTSGYSGDGGPASKAQLRDPYGVATDSVGNVYIADSANNVIREVSATTGMISTVAGNPALPQYSYSGDGGPATAAGLSFPTGLAVNSNGDFYIADNHNCVIRKVEASTGNISSVAGNGGPVFRGGGPATKTAIGFPQNVALDVFGNLFIVGNNWALEIQWATGVVNNIAGISGFGYSGDGGPASDAALGAVDGIAVDSSGGVYLADAGENVVRKITATSGVISTVVGNGRNGYSGDGGQATVAQLNVPFGVAADTAGNLYVSDTLNGLIRKVDASTGVITTVVGSANASSTPTGSGDGGPAASAHPGWPTGVAVDSGGNLYFADALYAAIRKVSAGTGIISTVAGTGVSGPYMGEGGAATQARLNSPRGVAVDSSGNVYIADTYNYAIHRVDTKGIITTVSTGMVGVRLPAGLAIDASNNLYIADQQNNVVRRVSLNDSTTSIVAGNGTAGYAGDNGEAVLAVLNQPAGVAVAANGDIYIADTGNNVIRKVTAATGMISTIGGTGVYGFGGDQGPATAARLANPNSVTIGSGNRLYVADTYNNRIRAVPGPELAPLPTVSPSFAGTSVNSGGTTTLSFLLTNPATTQAASAVSFRAALSPGLAVASPNGLSGSCGEVSASEGGQTVIVSGASLSAGGTCGFSIDVAATGLGSQYGTVADVVSGGQGANFFSLADVTIKGTAAVTNSASFAVGPLAPNAILVYFGPVACVPNERVLINGAPATILFGNSNQINFIAPESIAGTSGLVQVECNGSVAVSLPVTAGAVDPAVFTQTGTGTGLGSIVNGDGTVNSAAKPTPQGAYISVFGTGFGALNPRGSDGLRHLAAAVTATIDGVNAPVIYAGEAPDETIGLQQINIQVPTGITSGPSVPIVLSSDGMQTQANVTVAVQ